MLRLIYGLSFLHSQKEQLKMRRKLIEEPVLKWPLITLYLILVTALIVAIIKWAE